MNWKDLALSAAIFYGCMSLALFVAFTSMYATPAQYDPGWIFFTTSLALPFIVWPAWWVGIAAACGMLAGYFYARRKFKGGRQ